MKKHDKIVSLVKTKLNTIEVLIQRTIAESYISHNEFVLINIKLKEYDHNKGEIKSLKTSLFNQRF